VHWEQWCASPTFATNAKCFSRTRVLAYANAQEYESRLQKYSARHRALRGRIRAVRTMDRAPPPPGFARSIDRNVSQSQRRPPKARPPPPPPTQTRRYKWTQRYSSKRRDQGKWLSLNSQSLRGVSLAFSSSRDLCSDLTFDAEQIIHITCFLLHPHVQCSAASRSAADIHVKLCSVLRTTQTFQTTWRYADECITDLRNFVGRRYSLTLRTVITIQIIAAPYSQAWSDCRLRRVDEVRAS